MKTLQDIKKAFKTNKEVTVGVWTFKLDGKEVVQFNKKTKETYIEVNVGTIIRNKHNNYDAHYRMTFYNDMTNFENAIKRNLKNNNANKWGI